jgi:hypothetical protein
VEVESIIFFAFSEHILYRLVLQKPCPSKPEQGDKMSGSKAG